MRTVENAKQIQVFARNALIITFYQELQNAQHNVLLDFVKRTKNVCNLMGILFLELIKLIVWILAQTHNVKSITITARLQTNNISGPPQTNPVFPSVNQMNAIQMKPFYVQLQV